MRPQNLIPKNLRLQYKLWQRRRQDQRQGFLASFATPAAFAFQAKSFVETIQPIKKSYLFENKIHNLKLSSSQIESFLIRPGELFSFWNAIGNPTPKNGYKKGRNLIDGKLCEDYGGGLCQLSGILYHTSLKAGLDIVERHNHSLDIYREEDRFSPLGADATVVYGYKDLRVRNNRDCSIAFRFIVGAESIQCRLISEKTLPVFQIEFLRKQKKGIVEVRTKRSDGVDLGVSVYKLK